MACSYYFPLDQRPGMYGPYAERRESWGRFQGGVLSTVSFNSTTQQYYSYSNCAVILESNSRAMKKTSELVGKMKHKRNRKTRWHGIQHKTTDRWHRAVSGVTNKALTHISCGRDLVGPKHESLSWSHLGPWQSCGVWPAWCRSREY